MTDRRGRGPFDVVGGWFRSVRDSGTNLLALTMCAAGIFMLSRGLERWRVVTFMRDTGASRSPAPYRTTFEHWAKPVAAAGLSGVWYIAVSSASDIPRACAVASASPASFGRKLAVLAADDAQSRGRGDCGSFGEGSSASIPVLSASYDRIGNSAREVLQGGVALLDEQLAVRYASRWPKHLSRLPAVFETYSTDTQLAGGTR